LGLDKDIDFKYLFITFVWEKIGKESRSQIRGFFFEVYLLEAFQLQSSFSQIFVFSLSVSKIFCLPQLAKQRKDYPRNYNYHYRSLEKYCGTVKKALLTSNNLEPIIFSSSELLLVELTP